MINTNEENNFFKSINQCANTGATNPNLYDLSQNSLTEIENNLIELPLDERKAYLGRIERRVGEKYQNNIRPVKEILEEYLQKLKDFRFIYGNNYPSITELITQYNEIEKEGENQKKHETQKEIEPDEKNELIGLGYKQPPDKSILTKSQTALLIDYLQKNNVILSKHLGDSKAAKIFSVLTGYSNNTLRPNLSETQIVQLKNQSEKGQKEQFGNLKKLKEVLQNIISSIDKELEDREKL